MRLFTILVPFLLVSCGSANVNKIFGSNDESTSALLQKAQFAYDQGDYDAAEEYASKAYASTTSNGEAAILLGNIMLSKSGIDIFQLVEKLSEVSASSTSTTTSSSACESSSTDAAGSISKLSCMLLNLTADEVSALGTDKPLTSSALQSLGSYYQPSNVTDELRQKVNVLKYADRGIRYLCPFVNRQTVFTDSIDERHVLAKCGDKSSQSFNQVKVHIGFALLHLVETLVYQRSILVDGTTSSSSSTSKVGISTISSTINAQTFTNVNDFVGSMNEFKTVVDSLADTTSPTSQIALALDGLLVVSNSFTAAGVPAKITSSITGGLTKLKETAAKLSAAAGGSATGNYQAQALKGQINEKYAKTVATKMNTVCGADGSTCTAEQKTELCASYAGISEGVDPSKLTKPTYCP
jgi:hypothetical protein